MGSTSLDARLQEPRRVREASRYDGDSSSVIRPSTKPGQDHLHILGRKRRRSARISAFEARYHRRPPLRRTSRETVDGAQPMLQAMLRRDAPVDSPLEISSRWAIDKARAPRCLATGAMPPEVDSMTCTVPGIRSSARAMSLTDSPSFHLRQSSARSSAEGVRFALVMQHRDLHRVAWRYGVATTG